MRFAPLGRARVAAFSTWAVVFLTLSAPATSQPATQTTFSGQAVVVKATVAGVPIVLSETQPLRPEGGAEEVSLLEAGVPGVLSVQVLHASAVGQGNASRAEASVANLDLTVGGNRIEADFLMARAEARCTDGRASVQGSSAIAGLQVNDQSITVGTAPNQEIQLPNGRIVINEQRSSSSGNTGEITVTALHIVVDGVADVAISQAHADIACRAQQAACTNDFVTGGGWITSAGNRANFAVAGGIKNKGLWGHLTYHARNDGLKVKGTGVTAYEALGDSTRRIQGTAEVNGQGGFTYEVEVADNGEPGRDDTFKITLSNGHTASGTLGGGNIQLHRCRGSGAPI